MSEEKSTYEKYSLLKRFIKYLTYKEIRRSVVLNARRYGLTESALLSLNESLGNRIPSDLRLPEPVPKPDGIDENELLEKVAKLTPYFRGNGEKPDLDKEVEIFLHGQPVVISARTAVLLYLMDNDNLVKIAEEVSI